MVKQNSEGDIWQRAKAESPVLRFGSFASRLLASSGCRFGMCATSRRVPSGTSEFTSTSPRAINEPLDELDPIDGSYCLEVCSPGLERELIRDEHFEQYIGADVLVKLRRPVEGVGKEFDGRLKSYSDGEITVEDHEGENELSFTKKDMVWVKLDDFNI